MLAIFILSAMVGLGLLVYFWPAATDTETFNMSRISLTIAMFAYAGSVIFTRAAAAEGDKDILMGTHICEIIGWLVLANALKGLFIMLGSRARERQ